MVDIQKLTKLYYTIGEVAKLFDVSTSLLRYWESEFPQINPGKTNKGDRRYTKKDIQKIKTIYILLKEEGFTIEGAKSAYKKREERDNKLEEIKVKLNTIQKEMKKMRNHL
ncbi:MerR family transcriptional regulator [Membranihabitans maritimus]|uniref:MerR family transcriptional regulator n=1 Tax=Membranihabitans maritimus TaxID=2904244 RepID=UPI001F3DD420|nr:MerR family transcriptional regulator [Membranihabitans maritimus]